MKQTTLNQILKHKTSVFPPLNYVLIYNGYIYSPYDAGYIVKLTPKFDANFNKPVLVEKKLFSKLYTAINSLKFFTETNQLKIELQQEITITYKTEFNDDVFAFFQLYLDFEAKNPESVKYINEFDIQKIRTASKFVDTNEFRPALNHIEVSNTNIIATDAHLLYYPKASKEFTPIDFKLYIPKNIGNLINSLNPTACIYKTNDVKSSFYALEFYEPSVTILCNQHKRFDKYINWEIVIPKPDSYQNVLTFNLVDFKNTITQLLNFTDHVTNKVIINSKEDKVEISVNNLEDYDFDLNLTQTFYTLYQKKQTDIKYALNAKMLLKAVNALPKNTKTIELALGQTNRACVINNQILLMPILL